MTTDRSPRNRYLSKRTYNLLLASALQRRATRQAYASLDKSIQRTRQLIEQIKQEDRDAQSIEVTR